MKLVYSIPDKLWWIHDFLSYNMYKSIHNDIIKERKNINLRSVENWWSNKLISKIKAPDACEITKYQPFETLKTLVRHNVYFQLKDVQEIITYIHYMKKDTGIQWHDDNGWKYGATFYINRRWNENFGGEFMFSDNTDHGFLPYVENSLILVKAPLRHKVNPVKSKLMPRITVQMFMK